MAKVCSVCGAPLADNAKFCEFCGSPVPVEEAPAAPAPEPEVVIPHCEFCGAELKPGTRFCPVCGRSTEKAEESPRIEPAQAYIPPQPTAVPQPQAPEPEPVQPAYTAPAQDAYQQPTQQQYAPTQQQYAPQAQPQYAQPVQPQYAQPAAQPQEKKKKSMLIPIIAIAAAVVLIIVLVGGFVWPGFFKGAKADDPVLGTWKGAYSKFVGDSDKSTDPFSLELKKGGKGVSHRDDFDFNCTWTLDGENFTMQESFLGVTMDYTGTLKDGVLHLFNGDPTDEWTYEYVYTRDGSMPDESGAAVTPAGDSGTKSDTADTPSGTTAGGEEYDTGEFKVTVPEGWTVYPVSDIWSDDDDALDPGSLNVSKGGTSDWDMYSKPYIYITYGGPSTTLLAPDKDFYDNSEDIEPLTTGSHNWTGYKGESIGYKMYILFEDQGDVQYLVTVYYDMDGGKITLDDPDVRAILASIETTDPAAAASTPDTPAVDPADNPTTAGTGLPDIDRKNVDMPEDIEAFDWIYEDDDPGEWIEMEDASYLEGKWKVMHVYVDEDDYVFAYDLCSLDFETKNGATTATYHWYKYIPVDSEEEDESDLNPTEFVGTMYESSLYATNDELGVLAIHNFWVTDDAEYAGGTLTLDDGGVIYVYLMRP